MLIKKAKNDNVQACKFNKLLETSTEALKKFREELEQNIQLMSWYFFQKSF